MSELLPCPFCEGESKLAALRSIDDLRIAERYYIVCLDCGAQTAMLATIAAAIAAWNRRAVPDTTEMALLQRRLDAEFDVLFDKKEPLGQVPTSLAHE